MLDKNRKGKRCIMRIDISNQLCCIYQDGNCTGLWHDLKTVKGYIKRLRKYCPKTSDFQIFLKQIGTGKTGRYLAVMNKPDKYWDYRINEYRERAEIVNHDLGQVIDF